MNSPLAHMALAFFALAAAAASSAGPLRMLLSAETEVPSDTILLVDLLPKDTPPSWRAAAQKISLGRAPQNGATRNLHRESVLAALLTAGLPSSSFDIPDFIAVRRASRLLTPEDTFAAIQSALANNSALRIPSLYLENIELEAAVRVPIGDPRLLVTQTVFDPFIGRARFRLRSRAFPGILPFYATARIPSSLPVQPSEFQLIGSAFQSALANFPASSPVLVEPARLATLHLHSPNANSFLSVKPLQSGRLGDTIRIRIPGNAKTLQARVTAADSLDASF